LLHAYTAAPKNNRWLQHHGRQHGYNAVSVSQLKC
jgi:hypothetical protein